jgi:hypothetical protein
MDPPIGSGTLDLDTVTPQHRIGLRSYCQEDKKKTAEVTSTSAAELSL